MCCKHVKRKTYRCACSCYNGIVINIYEHVCTCMYIQLYDMYTSQHSPGQYGDRKGHHHRPYYIHVYTGKGGIMLHPCRIYFIMKLIRNPNNHTRMSRILHHDVGFSALDFQTRWPQDADSAEPAWASWVLGYANIYWLSFRAGSRQTPFYKSSFITLK